MALNGGYPLGERKRWLLAIATAQLEHREALALIITLENGKPLHEARGEVDYAAGFYTEAARLLGSLEPRVLRTHPKQHEWTVFHRPAGVAALITPWSFPLAMLAKKASATLAAGAPIVVKPAEVTATANATEYGLAAYVFTRDSARASRLAERLRFGHVGLNSGTGPTAEAPFGGMKQSGLGREGGVEGLLEFVELQVLTTPLRE